MKCGSQHLRSGTTFDNYFVHFNVHYIYVSAGSACRYKVIGWLKKFGNPREAELYYGLCENQHRSVQTDLSLLHHREDITSSLSACVTVSSSVQTEQSGEQLSFDYNIEYLTAVFSQLCEKELGVQIPKDFLVFASSASYEEQVKYFIQFGKGYWHYKKRWLRLKISNTTNANWIGGVYSEFLCCR